jgi:membrane protease YdiL (CAAX protease family)
MKMINSLFTILIFFCIFITSNVESEDLPIQKSITESRDNEKIRSNYGVPRKLDEPNPRFVALLGVIPGLGQAYLGNYNTAAFQLGFFMGLNTTRRHFVNQKDYLNYSDRNVTFDPLDAYLGYSFRKNDLVYNDLPFFSESASDRDIRLLKERKISEVNTYIKYGDYTRTNRNTFYADHLGNPELSTIFYSIYSSYRDAGGMGEYKKKETFDELAFAPFHWSVMKNLYVLVPVIGIGLIGYLDSVNYNGENPILIPNSLKKDGSLLAGAFITGISPAIGEEAFFRGYLNYNLTMKFGAINGLGMSSTLFMLAHEGNTDAREGRLSRLLMGAYLGYVHMKFGYDLRPSIAIHFWWNFIIGLSQIVSYKADPNYNKSQREVFYMPITYTIQF